MMHGTYNVKKNFQHFMNCKVYLTYSQDLATFLMYIEQTVFGSKGTHSPPSNTAVIQHSSTVPCA